MNQDKKMIHSSIDIVDSHQHFWQLSRGGYCWLTPSLEKLYQNFLPENLKDELLSNNVKQTVLIQADDNEEETLFLLELAENTKFIAGVVGWIDMDDQLAISHLQKLTKNPYFKGIRPMLQDIEDVNWILKEKFNPIFQFMIENKLTFDALVRDVHLASIHILASRYPALNIVIDHCAKPDLSKSPSDMWMQSLIDLAQCDNVFIKLSGLLTEAPIGQVKVETLTPYFEHIINSFSTSRVMWGSDWPVLKLNGDYASWVSLTHTLLNNCSNKDKCKILAENAQKFYKLSSN